MKKNFLLILTLVFISVAYGQIRTINIDTKTDALLLTPNNSKMVNNLTVDQPYNITVSTDSISGSPMQGAFVVMQDASGEVDARFAPSGSSFEFVPINNSYQFAAFYVDWSTTDDNSGTVTLNIDGPTNQVLNIDTKNDAILLDTVTTIVSGLDPNQEYVVSVRDSAISGVLLRGCYFMSEDVNGIANFKYIPSGQAFTFKPINSNYQVAPLYVDWSTTDDNIGKIIVDITKSAITGINSHQESLKLWKLNQNYPNPFNPSTTIQYSIPKESFVSIKIYDILGRNIATLVNKRESMGIYYINFNASSLSSGIYFYQLKAGTFVQTKKMVVLK